MQQAQQHDNNHNDNDYLLTENDTKLCNQERLAGFIQEYQVKIINKLNLQQTKNMLWAISLEFYLSIALLVYLYLEDSCNQFEVYQYFPFVIITVLLIELVLKISLSFNLRKEALQFYSFEKVQVATKGKYQEQKNENKWCRVELLWLWGLFQLEIFYVNCLSRKLMQYNSKIIEYDERINEIHEQKVSHQSIQALFSYVKFRQICLNMKLCIFLLLLKDVCSDYSTQLIVLAVYIGYLVCVNIWINFHFAVVYLFCRSSILSRSDFLILISEIAIKCLHSLVFIYLLTHIEGIYTPFSAVFISLCTILSICIVIQLNTLFDKQAQGVFDMLFLGYSTNYYVGLKHREYFVKRVAYRYKLDIFKQIIIFIFQLAIILDYYESNVSLLQMKQEVILGVISTLAISRVLMTLFKITFYLKPKQLLIRIKAFAGSPHFIEENISPHSLQTLTNIQNSIKIIQQQQQNQTVINTNTNITIHDQIYSTSLQQIPSNSKSNKKEQDIRELIYSKLEQSHYKMTFLAESELCEFELNPELKLILNELIKYKKSELIILISNQIKIQNQYGHINVLIHKYDRKILEFIENYIIPQSRSIQIDSCYQNNSDLNVQLMLLYNTIYRELDVNTKIILKPQDLVQQLPIPYPRKQAYLQIVNQICNAKHISILKIIALNRQLSPFLLQNPCYVLYDLVDSD